MCAVNTVLERTVTSVSVTGIATITTFIMGITFLLLKKRYLAFKR